METKGGEYFGTQNQTQSGVECIPWSEISSPPFKDNFVKSIKKDSDDYKNFCRNPDEDLEGPWCLIPGTPVQSWAYCGIPLCAGTENETE